MMMHRCVMECHAKTVGHGRGKSECLYNQHMTKINKTDLGKYTHQCDKTQGNNSTQVLSTKIVFFGCKKRDRQQKKKEAKKRRQEEADVQNV